MTTKTIHDTAHNAKRMADALEKAGIKSSLPPPDPDPYLAVKDIYLRLYPLKELSEFMSLRRDAMKGYIPRAGYYRKLAMICRAALRRGVVPDDKVEAVAFAWGYFTSKASRPANDSD